MDSQRTDFLTGLFILVTAGVVLGALIVTSDLGVVRHDLYLRIASAEDLTSDTRVLLQGLEIGRVRQVNPVRDPETRRISFIARMAVQDRFPNGTELTLPVGTRAVVSQATPIAPTVVNMILPGGPAAAAVLEPGDTLEAERVRSTLDQLSEIAAGVRGELREAMEDTRELIRQTNAAVRLTRSVLSTNQPLMEEALARLVRNLEQTEAVLADVAPRVGPTHDSLTAALGQTRHVLARLDTLVFTAQGMAMENRDVIREIAASLHRSATVLEHFTDQISRRPTRILTGVTPPADSGRSPR